MFHRIISVGIRSVDNVLACSIAGNIVVFSRDKQINLFKNESNALKLNCQQFQDAEIINVNEYSVLRVAAGTTPDCSFLVSLSCSELFLIDLSSFFSGGFYTRHELSFSGSSLADVTSIVFSSDCSHILLSTQYSLHVYQSQVQNLLWSRHFDAFISEANFLNGRTTLPLGFLVTVQGVPDCMVKVWDITGVALFSCQDSSVHTESLTAIGLQCFPEIFASTRNAKVKHVEDKTNVISFHVDSSSSLLQSQVRCDLDVRLRRISSVDAPGSPGDSTHVLQILPIYFTNENIGLNSVLLRESSFIRDIHDNHSILIIGTNKGLLLVDGHTMEVRWCLDIAAMGVINGHVINEWAFPSSDKSLFGEAFVAFCSFLMNPVMYCVSVDLKHCILDNFAHLKGQSSAFLPQYPVSSKFSVLSSEPVLKNSPLKFADNKTPTKNSSSKLVPINRFLLSGQASGTLDKQGKISKDKPVTVHAKVKSSGYSKITPPRKMFQPVTGHKKQPCMQNKPKPGKSVFDFVKISSSYEKGYEFKHLQSEVEICNDTCLTAFKYSWNGNKLVTGTTKGLIVLSRTSAEPISPRLQTYIGHKQRINSCCWSKSGKQVISASDDASAIVWCMSSHQSLFTLNNTKESTPLRDGLDNKNSTTNSRFSKPITSAQFYFDDRFILLACASSIYLYSYVIDTTKSDIQRYQCNSSYKQVTSIVSPSGNYITSMTAVNIFNSYVVLCTNSDRSLAVFDMNVGKIVTSYVNIHDRPAHCIAQNQGSLHCALGDGACNLFITSAISDGIKLWDVRTPKSVRRFDGHACRSYPCGIAFSPCGRHISTGSEDRSVCFYETRGKSVPLARLTEGVSATTTAVNFNPAKPQLAAVTLEGSLLTFV